MASYGEKMFLKKMHFWQNGTKYRWKAGDCFRYQNNKALVPSIPNFMNIAIKLIKKTFKFDLYLFLKIFCQQTAKAGNI